MLVYGYCRISTKKQLISRQIANIKAVFPDAVIIQEVYTGTKIEGRKEWNKLYERIKREIQKEEITIVFDEVSRMARNAEAGYSLYEELFALGVNLVFLKEPHINTETYKNAINNKLTVSLETADEATQALMESIIDALNNYILTLAKQQIYLAFERAEEEAEYLHQRTKEGLQQAKLNGKRIGTEKGAKLTTKKSVEMKKVIQAKSNSFEGNISDSDLIKITGLSRNTFYKYKRELQEELSK